MPPDPFDMLYDSVKELFTKHTSLGDRVHSIEVRLESTTTRIAILYGAITVIGGAVITGIIKIFFGGN